MGLLLLAIAIATIVAAVVFWVGYSVWIVLAAYVISGTIALFLTASVVCLLGKWRVKRETPVASPKKTSPKRKPPKSRLTAAQAHKSS